tara:strand:+ start:368 stop:499 length:132 start_codon:yes stop_codon:yes gene_type:complete
MLHDDVSNGRKKLDELFGYLEKLTFLFLDYCLNMKFLMSFDFL